MRLPRYGEWLRLAGPQFSAPTVVHYYCMLSHLAFYTLSYPSTFLVRRADFIVQFFTYAYNFLYYDTTRSFALYMEYFKSPYITNFPTVFVILVVIITNMYKRKNKQYK